MKYILDVFEDEEFWIELDNDGYALRQMIVGENNVEMSCFTDCLAEGVVALDELAGEIKIITQDIFEYKWDKYIKNFKEEWENKKKNIILVNK